jgi:hypothetical protein
LVADFAGVHVYEGVRGGPLRDGTRWGKKLIGALIFAVSIATTLEFFVLYCRAIVVASLNTRLSGAARTAAGIEGEAMRSDDFVWLMQLTQLCLPSHGDRLEIFLVRIYYGLLQALRAPFPYLASLDEWTGRERIACSHFAAVVLDRRISHCRELMAQQGRGL